MFYQLLLLRLPLLMLLVTSTLLSLTLMMATLTTTSTVSIPSTARIPWQTCPRPTMVQARLRAPWLQPLCERSCSLPRLSLP
jgi:hypothetical protein